ncbi:MAG: hypothetical protein KBF93_02170 [Leptospiraceae bacterium]|nr:hypothetical protein [Leptospiraceae bacterium]
MKKLIVILLLSLSYCENMESNKKVEKQDPFNIALALRAVVVTQFPYPLAGSCSRETTNSKFCINGFSHSPHSCGEGLTNVGRCSAQNSVGVCVFYSLGSVSESVYYSPEFTQEQARQRCNELAEQPLNQGSIIKFQEVYNLENVYYPNKSP